jgi:hypothetical protein
MAVGQALNGRAVGVVGVVGGRRGECQCVGGSSDVLAQLSVGAALRVGQMVARHAAGRAVLSCWRAGLAETDDGLGHVILIQGHIETWSAYVCVCYVRAERPYHWRDVKEAFGINVRAQADDAHQVPD